MALIQWKQINPQLGGNGQLSGSLEISGSLRINGADVSTGLSGDIVSLNTYTGSADTRITSLESFSSSLDASFATDQQLTDISTSLASSISGISTDFNDITNKPTLLSSSAQIAADISGSFTSISASLAADIAQIVHTDGTYNGNRVVSNESLPTLFSTAFNANTTGSIQNFLDAVFFPNNPPTFNSPANQEVVEFNQSGSTIVTLSASDTEGQAVTFQLASSYTEDLVKVSSSGVVTLNTVPENAVFNTVDRGDGELAHAVPIEVIDTFGAKTTQTFYFKVAVNTAPKFRQTSTSGTIISSYIASRNENASAGQVSRVYFTDNEGDSLTITSASSPDGHFTLTKYPTYVQIDQVTASLDYETKTSYTMSITASDEHYPSQDATSITYLPITINVTDNFQPTINNQEFSGINENSSTGTSAGTITAGDAEGDTRTFFEFTLAKLELDNVDVPIGTYTGTSQLTDPTENPFQMNSSGAVTRKSGVYLNSDLINEYQYTVKVKDSYNTTSNTATVTIPIVDDAAPSITPNGTFYIIESAETNATVKTNSNGFTGTQAKFNTNQTVTWSTDSTLIQLNGSGLISLSDNVSGSYNSGQSFTANITATNTFGTTTQTTPTFNVTANQAPVIVITDLAFDTDQAISGSNIASVTISDQETDTPYTVTLSGTHASSFGIVSQNIANSTLFIQPNTPLTQGTYNINVDAVDAFGKSTSTSTSLVVTLAASYGKIYVYTSTYGSDAGFGANYNAVMGASTVNSDIPPQVTGYSANTLSPYYKLKTGSVGDSSITLAGSTAATLQATVSGSNLDTALQVAGAITANTTGQVWVVYPSGSDMVDLPTTVQESFNSVSLGAVPCMNVDGNGFGIESGQLHSLVLDTPHLGYSEWFVFGRKSQNAIASNFIIRMVPANGTLPS